MSVNMFIIMSASLLVNHIYPVLLFDACNIFSTKNISSKVSRTEKAGFLRLLCANIVSLNEIYTSSPHSFKNGFNIAAKFMPIIACP